ncbi:MAG: precorrin-2 C(20)-methyltransferase [Firmicutes bacterium]|jgi:precorrin-2/cobalt-factor-2 C20-methyltransferase|nr:precorrin-2 C(20)-methyltransferase [Bacillota bacterium]
MTRIYGTLFGLGAGAGNPEWLTLQADRILKRSRVIALPRGIARVVGRAEEIVEAYLTPDKYLLRLAFPMTQDENVLARAWNDARDQVLSHLTQGLDVVFVTEGDPSLYSTFSYLADAVLAKCPEIAVEIVPGISSVSAAAARLGVSLARSGQSVAVIPAVNGLNQLSQALDVCDTVVILKFSRVFDRVYELLDSRGLLPDTVYLAGIGTTQEEIRGDLHEMKERVPPYMSLLVVRQRCPD